MRSIRSIAAICIVTASMLLSGTAHAVSEAPTAEIVRATVTPCAPGGTVVLEAPFGPNYDWTLYSERFPGRSNCTYVAVNQGPSGKLVLKTKMTINGITTRDTQRCFRCAGVSFGTGGYDQVVVKAIAYKLGSDVAYTTGWRIIRR